MQDLKSSTMDHIETTRTLEEVGTLKELEPVRTIQDPVFGEITEGVGPQYRNVGWFRTSVLMMKTQIGIGALGIPGAFNLLGLIPGIIVLVCVAGITTWSNYIIGRFKLRHPEVYALDDAGQLMFGRIGREIFHIAYQLFYVFAVSAALVSISTCLNALSSHGACTAVFIGVAAIAAFLLSSVRTLSRISWVAWIGMICILVSVFTICIAVGAQDRPAAAPQTGSWTSDYKLFRLATFSQAMSGVAIIIYAFTGTPYFFSIISEMKRPEDYFKSMYLAQSVVFTVYFVIGTVVYYYCGSYVSSPALGSAGPLLKKVAYGIALPGLLVTTMIVAHVPAKNFFVRLLRGTDHLTSNSIRHWCTWLSCTLGTVVVAYIIASAIPAFSTLISLIGALLGTSISMQAYGAMWLYDNWRPEARTRFWNLKCAWAMFVIVIGFFCMAGGSYAAILDIIAVYQRSTGGSAAWSCADNSNSS